MSRDAATLEGAAWRSRLCAGLVISLCAGSVAWLGPAWRVPVPLAVVGSVILWGLAAASVCYRGAAGARPRARPLFGALAILIGAGFFAGIGEDRPRTVLVERFHPGEVTTARPPDAAAGDALELDGEGFQVLSVSYRLDEPAGRERLGAITGRSLTEADVRGVEGVLVFVNGALVAPGRDTPRQAVEREVRAVDAESVAVETRYAGDTVRLECSAPAGAVFTLVRVREEERSSPAASRYAAVDVERCRAERKPGAEGGGVCGFTLAIESRAAGGEDVLLVVSCAERVVGVFLLTLP